MTGLAINTVLQSHHVNDFEGADAASVTFDAMPQSNVQEMVTSGHGEEWHARTRAIACIARTYMLELTCSHEGIYSSISDIHSFIHSSITAR